MSRAIRSIAATLITLWLHGAALAEAIMSAPPGSPASTGRSSRSRATSCGKRWCNCRVGGAASTPYSGQASNLSLDAQAGGCWCERWADGQSVQHGTVALTLPGRVLRVLGNLGPLQDLPVQGVLTFAITAQDGKTSLRMTYRVAGPADAGLEKLAPLVDRVMGEQYKRLKALVETGKPE